MNKQAAADKVLGKENTAFLAQKLKDGAVVGIPTDTVYGVAALMSNLKAVDRIYRIKNRPRNKPLIIFVSDPHQVDEFVEEMPPFGIELMEAFWPGPLTLIFPAADTVSREITAGLNTVGVRIPDCKIVMDILKLVKEPLCVTSANLSGKKDPVTAEEVMAELGDSLDYVLDGGVTHHKLVSTIVDVTGARPKIIRQGALKKSKLENVVMDIE
ncbi:MAG: L-threonylcarbamoyladenylate synthase [Candidatus Firestonebacteria bacterium]